MIALKISNNVAEIVLENPEKLNALNLEAIEELTAAYESAETAGVRALLLHGTGRAFCAGRDIAGVDPQTDDVLGFLELGFQPLLEKISRFPAPTFAVAHGACLGVGLGLLIATDVVYVADSAKIGSPFAKLGATLDSGGHALFVERLGAHKTLDLIYSGRLMAGDEAVNAGLFSRVLPADNVLAEARAAAAEAAQGATQAFVASKKLVAQIRDEKVGLWRSMTNENRAQAALCATEDYREGFDAFQTKRVPQFWGRRP